MKKRRKLETNENRVQMLGMRLFGTTIAIVVASMGCASSTAHSDHGTARPPASTGDNAPYGTNIEGGSQGAPPPSRPRASVNSGSNSLSSGGTSGNAVVSGGNSGGATCVTGVIETASRAPIPVASAHVGVHRDGVQVGETSTDENGRFAWCAAKGLEGQRLVLRVEKGSFVTIDQPVELAAGVTKQVNIDMALRD